LAVYTDSPRYAAAVLPDQVVRQLTPVDDPDPGIDPLLGSIFQGDRGVHQAAWDLFPYPILISEYSPRSQYDQLIRLARNRAGLPKQTACLAGSGRDFHGFKGRSWAAVPGNIHLSVHLAPNRPVGNFHVAFTALAALSVAEAIDQLGELPTRPGIKWVNDILMGSAKVAGVLAYTLSRDTTVTSVVLGFGVNVEATPRVRPTPFVPEVASLRDFLPPTGPDRRAEVFRSLLEALDRNYRTLLVEGATPLLKRYRERSMIMGREVTVCTEASDRSLKIVDQGMVTGFGENLELFLDGRSAPITGGRLILGRVTIEEGRWASEPSELPEAQSVPELASTPETRGSQTTGPAQWR